MNNGDAAYPILVCGNIACKARTVLYNAMLAGRSAPGVIGLFCPSYASRQLRFFLNHAKDMPAHVVLEPEGCTPAEPSQPELLKNLLPFTFAISGFRGKPFTERGLIVHYKPQV